MAYTFLRYEKKENFATLTIARPEVLNALSAALLGELGQVIGEVGRDDSVRVLIITGQGEKAFVAGADIKELEALSSVTEAQVYIRRGQVLFDCIENLGKPVIAAVNGFALGGGCELAMACSIRIASEKARFGQPEITLGIMPAYGGTQRLPRLVGKGRALELLVTGKMIDAQEALRIGLVNAVVPPDALLSTAEGLARTIASQSPIAIRLILDAVNKGIGMTLEDGLLLESYIGAQSMLTPDAKKGLRAFLEKKK